jgi:hypothetical protein
VLVGHRQWIAVPAIPRPELAVEIGGPQIERERPRIPRLRSDHAQHVDYGCACHQIDGASRVLDRRAGEQAIATAVDERGKGQCTTNLPCRLQEVATMHLTSWRRTTTGHSSLSVGGLDSMTSVE